MEDPRFRRIARRPERDHLPFGVGARRGPLISRRGWHVIYLACCFLLGLALARILVALIGAHP
jgi:hypothetical protein